MNRKYIAFILMLVVVWLAGCGATQNDPDGNENSAPIESVQTPDDPVDPSTDSISTRDEQPFDELSFLLHRLETLKSGEIKGVTDSIWIHVGNDFKADNTQLATRINAAAKNYIGYEDHNDPVGLLKLYFSESRCPEMGDYEAADFTISSSEDIVHVSYHIEDNEQGLHFQCEISLQDAELYRHLYSLYMENRPLDEEALEKYGEILSERARLRMDYHNENYVQHGFPVLTGFEIAYLRLYDSFDYGEYHYEIYSWDPGFFTDDPNPERYGWPQDAMPDHLGRIRYYEECRYFVVAWANDDPEYEFFSNSISYDWNLNFYADIIKHFTGEISPILLLPEEQATQTARLDDAVIEYAVECVQQMIAYHNELGADGGYSIIEAHITSIEYIPVPAVGLTDGLYLYRLEYRLLADHPENVILSGGMTMDGEWITEWGSTGQPYLLFWHDWSEGQNIWKYICVTSTDVIMTEYATPEMLAKYDDPYLAASVELYHKYLQELEAVSYSMIRDGFLYRLDGSVVAISSGTPVAIAMTAAQVTVNHNGWELTAEYCWAKYGNALIAHSNSGDYSVVPLLRSDRYLRLILDMGYTYLIDTETGEVLDPLAALGDDAYMRLHSVNFSPDGRYAVVSHHSATVCVLLNCTTGEIAQLPYASDLYSIYGYFLDDTHILLSSLVETDTPHEIEVSYALYDVNTGERTEITAPDSIFFTDDALVAYTYEDGYLVFVDLMSGTRTATSFRKGQIDQIFYCHGELACVVSDGVLYLINGNGDANAVCKITKESC